MNNLKNLLIAVLTGLLALSLFTQPAQGEGPEILNSKTAKAIQYDHCLRMETGKANSRIYLDQAISTCIKYRP